MYLTFLYNKFCVKDITESLLDIHEVHRKVHMGSEYHKICSIVTSPLCLNNINFYIHFNAKLNKECQWGIIEIFLWSIFCVFSLFSGIKNGYK